MFQGLGSSLEREKKVRDALGKLTKERKKKRLLAGVSALCSVYRCTFLYSITLLFDIEKRKREKNEHSLLFSCLHTFIGEKALQRNFDKTRKPTTSLAKKWSAGLCNEYV